MSADQPFISGRAQVEIFVYRDLLGKDGKECVLTTCNGKITLEEIGSSNASIFTSNREISDQQYFHHNPLEATYNFGYDINADGTFHHQRRGQDGVTYGCYGYVDPNGKLHASHYVSDRRGYRVVEPNKPVPIFFNDESDSDDSKKDSRFEVRPWHALFLPKGCGRNIVDSGVTRGPELIYKPPGAIVTTATPASTTVTSTRPSMTSFSSTNLSIESSGSTVQAFTEHTRAPPFFWLFTTPKTSTAAPTTTSESTAQKQPSPCACGESLISTKKTS